MTGNEAPQPGPDQVAAEHAEFAWDDAAYLLGALPADRMAAFEQHLLRCARCQDAVAELSELPGLLGRVRSSDLDELDDDPPDTLLPRLLSEVSADRRRRSWRTAGTGFAVACALALLVGLGGLAWSDSHRPHARIMAEVGPNTGTVQATVTLLGSGTGTRIRLDCGYGPGTGTAGSYPAAPTHSYRMIAFNRLGQQRDLGSWTPQPGESVELVRDSPWPRDNLGRIEVSDDRGVTVLQLALP